MAVVLEALVAARRASVALLVLALAGPASGSVRVPEPARAGGALDEGNPRVEARLLVDAEVVQAGKPVRVGVLFDLDRGWHVYWRNPGQSGLPTELDWNVPEGSVGPIRWPAPEVFGESDGYITTYGYDRQVLLMNDLTFRPSVRGERVIAVGVEFLACKVRCIPGRLELERKLIVADTGRPADPETHALFERYSRRVPVSPDAFGLELDALYSQSAIRPGDRFRAAVVALPCIGEPERADCAGWDLGKRDPGHAFVPDRMRSVELRVTGSRPHPFTDGGFLVTLDGRATADDPGGPERLRGVLAVRVPDGEVRWVEVDLPLPRADAAASVVAIDNPWLDPVTPAGFGGGVPLWQAILLALAGGVVLNLMPCVLPVLALKVFGITELAHRSRREVTLSGLAYAAGILASMLALAVVVLLLRAAGTAVGWGFQFQEPVFIAAISTVLLVFALNLFGVFDITFDATAASRMGEGAAGTRRSFFEGLLAVVVATPCSAPFLGTAVGFAFASSTSVIVAVFLAIGLGLAAPYLIVTWIPGWARIIPRPGPWMLQVRRVLGFALLGTVVWLGWVFGRTAGVDGLVALLAFLFAVAFVTWIFGSLQRARYARLARGVAVVLVGLAGAGLFALPVERASTPVGAVTEDGRVWEVFEPSAIRARLEEGRPVLVTFTADWCLTCKANERFVLGDARVQAELDRLDVATFKADWTQRDERIRAELARFGRAGVPMYLLYSPKSPGRPRVLPELLTVEGVVEALRQAAPGAGTRT